MASSSQKAKKVRLYKVERYYAVPATVYLIATDKVMAIQMSDDRYGKAKSVAKRIKLIKPRHLVM